MILYAESSAVSSWLFQEERGAEMMGHLAGADGVVASRLTLFECSRSLKRGVELGRFGERDADAGSARLAHAALQWHLVDISSEVLVAADRRFPAEPLRSLDALHLGTALRLRSDIPDLAILTLDDRIAANARLLGFPVLPEPPAPRKGRRR